MVCIWKYLLSLENENLGPKGTNQQLIDTLADIQYQTQSQRHHPYSRRAGGEELPCFSLQTVLLQPITQVETLFWKNRKKSHLNH